jgi:hypothetical protein
MTTITNEYMQQELQKTKQYTMIILKPGPNVGREDVQQIIWEHGRRNFQLRADGVMNIVSPIATESEIVGIAILDTDVNTAKELMDEDPAIKEGVFVYEALSCRSFPGDILK